MYSLPSVCTLSDDCILQYFIYKCVTLNFENKRFKNNKLKKIIEKINNKLAISLAMDHHYGHHILSHDGTKYCQVFD